MSYESLFSSGFQLYESLAHLHCSSYKSLTYLGSSLESLAHLGSSCSFESLAHLIYSVHLFSLLNMKKISIFLQFSSGNIMIGVSFILSLCQWGRFSRGKNCLIANAIQNKHRAGRASEQWNKQKVDKSFSFLN